MNTPKANFTYWPLSGKKPLEVNFINQSENTGGYDEWSSCSISDKYFISHLNSLSDMFSLDFSEWSEEGILQTYNENGFKLESTGAYYYDINSDESYVKEKNITDQIYVDLEKDFHIELTIVKFKNYHGSIQLYFEQLPVDNGEGVIYGDIGIHINTNNGNGTIRYFNNLGESNVAVLTDYNLPVKIKFIKIDDRLELYINDEKIIYTSSGNLGIGKKTGGVYETERNLLCPLKFKIKTQNNLSNWCMHIKDIYVVNSENKDGDESYRGNLSDNGLGFSALYNWNFNDGTNSSEENPIHVFNNEGPINVIMNIITENGSDSISKNLNIYSDSADLSNAGEIFREENEDIVRDLDSIPDYCSDIRIRNIINAAIHDAIRYVDTISENLVIKLIFTLDKTENNSRNIKCEVSFLNLNENIISEHIVRTLVEKNEQNYLVCIEFELEDPI